TGTVRRADLTAAAEAAVFNAKPGQVVGPVKTTKGWELLRIEALQPATLDDATLITIKKRLFDEWLQDARANARLHQPLLTT
ncbi:MAG: hypothetical protein HOP19_23595, partial [Acidobacteria bacterium]|nr:hypothetical protein [Acidobacteriota bacterium]